MLNGSDILKGKKVILGVTGGIAAYKACLIVRSLVSKGAEVKVVMTPSALEFITPLTLATLSQNEVVVNTFPANQKNGVDLKTWHIDYGLWADLMIIAPATVNTVAKMRFGIADNALTTLVCALREKLLIAPAADMDMYNTPANMENLKVLEERGAYIVNAEEGFLASGLTGPGRMAEPSKIIDAAELLLSGYTKDFRNKRILVTAGPTYEDIDPVRYIGNRSSGKMGFAIARAAYLRGADVTVISGPSAETGYPEIDRITVRSAVEMKNAVESNFSENDILIMSAAVADYRPAEYSGHKIKKSEKLTSVELVENPDILASIKKRDGQHIVGFALETDDLDKNAKLKLEKKNLDMIVGNTIKDNGAGFEFDTNKITCYTKNNCVEFPLLSKFQTANNILAEIKKII